MYNLKLEKKFCLMCDTLVKITSVKQLLSCYTYSSSSSTTRCAQTSKYIKTWWNSTKLHRFIKIMSTRIWINNINTGCISNFRIFIHFIDLAKSFVMFKQLLSKSWWNSTNIINISINNLSIFNQYRVRKQNLQHIK